MSCLCEAENDVEFKDCDLRRDSDEGIQKIVVFHISYHNETINSICFAVF